MRKEQSSHFSLATARNVYNSCQMKNLNICDECPYSIYNEDKLKCACIDNLLDDVLACLDFMHENAKENEADEKANLYFDLETVRYIFRHCQIEHLNMCDECVYSVYNSTEISCRCISFLYEDVKRRLDFLHREEKYESC